MRGKASDREFMLALNDRGTGEVDVFAYQLAEKLGKTVGELDDMPHDEYVGWQSYLHVCHVLEGMRRG